MDKAGGKIIVQVIESSSHKQKKHGAVQWQFLNHSLGHIDLKTLEAMGISVYVESECIDERSAPQTILTGKVRLEYNVPGGGFDYLSLSEIQKILSLSRGDVVLDPHRNCGWGGIRFNFYKNYKKPINQPLPETTMVLPREMEISNGIEYIKYLVTTTIRENNFVNSIARSPKLEERFSFKTDYDKFLQRIFKSKTGLNIQDPLDKDVLGLAFTYGKLKELKAVMEEVGESLGVYNAFIRLNPDMLFDQPHLHAAKGALLNLTQRRFTSRFVVEGSEGGTFFADINLDRLNIIMDLIISIMESEHSATKDQAHDIYLMVNGSDLNIAVNIINQYKNNHRQVNTYKHVYLYSIENDDYPKSRQDLLGLVR